MNAANTIADNYNTLYYPGFTYGYAYCPTTREDLLDKFKEHNWWYPSYGELIRITYYYHQYKTASTNTADNPLNIFRGAILAGALTEFSSSYYGCSIEPSQSYTSQTYRVHMNNSANNFGGAVTTSKATSNAVRPICMF